MDKFYKNIKKLLEKYGDSYSYPEAGKNASESVRAAIEEFHKLPEEEKTKTPLLYYILGSGTPKYKMSKEDSQYEDTSLHEDENCDNCEYQYLKTSKKKYICSQISGEIRPEGWCKLHELAEGPYRELDEGEEE